MYDYKYDCNLIEAANRHFRDARKLEDHKCYDNAGYLYGFAAECAVKYGLCNVGVLSNDPAIWEHFPQLRDKARLALQGRSAGKLFSLLQSASFMQHWDVKMRYSRSAMVDSVKAAKWREDANRVIGLTTFG